MKWTLVAALAALPAAAQAQAPATPLFACDAPLDLTIQGAARPDARLGQEPPDGRIQHVQLWRRRWEGAWNLSVQLAPDRHQPGAGGVYC